MSMLLIYIWRVIGIEPEYMSSLFSTTLYRTCGGSKLVQPKVNTITFGINCFAYQGSKICSNLPDKKMRPIVRI